MSFFDYKVGIWSFNVYKCNVTDAMFFYLQYILADFSCCPKKLSVAQNLGGGGVQPPLDFLLPFGVRFGEKCHGYKHVFPVNVTQRDLQLHPQGLSSSRALERERRPWGRVPRFRPLFNLIKHPALNFSNVSGLFRFSAKYPHNPILHYTCGSMSVVLCIAARKEQRRSIVPHALFG